MSPGCTPTSLGAFPVTGKPRVTRVIRSCVLVTIVVGRVTLGDTEPARSRTGVSRPPGQPLCSYLGVRTTVCPVSTVLPPVKIRKCVPRRDEPCVQGVPPTSPGMDPERVVPTFGGRFRP